MKQILQDPKIISLINYIQKNNKADLYQIAQQHPDIAPKLMVLIQKGLLNVSNKV